MARKVTDEAACEACEAEVSARVVLKEKLIEIAIGLCKTINLSKDPKQNIEMALEIYTKTN